jgi:phosphoribosylcarboxyaminoimidazole (NCAIR) mutase
VPAARLKAEEEIQLKQMLDEQRAIREQQNVQWTQQALEPLQTLLGPGLALVRGAAPVAGPLAPAVAAGTVGLAALAPAAGAVASGLSKLGAYGRVEATPAMREEARRRAQTAVQRQQFVAEEEPNFGGRFVSTVGDVLEDVVRPYVGLFEEAKAIPQALDRLKRPGVVAAAGKLLVGTPLTEEQEAVRLGGQFAENLKRVQSAPDQLIAVGPRAEKGAATGRTYEQIVSPKVAARNHPKEFKAWSKRFPEQAKKIREEISKAGDAGRISNKLAAGNVPSVLEVPQAERESLVRIAEMGKPVPLPTPEELGVSDAQWLAALRKAGVSDKEVDDDLISADTAERFKAALAAP